MKRAARGALWLALESGLRLLHPFMPFVTEELWQRLPQPAGGHPVPSIMLAPYPAPSPSWEDAGLEADFEFMQTVVNKVGTTGRKGGEECGSVRADK